MPSDIQSRLKKLPPFDDDIPMIRDVKKIAQQQNPQPEPEEEPEVEEEPQVEEEEVEEPKEEKKEPKKKKKKDRTKKQFEKLKKHNKELKEETEVLRENVLDSLRPKEQEALPSAPPFQEFAPQVVKQAERLSTDLNPERVDDIYASLIDENGYIDPDLLIKTLKSANEEAKIARQEAEEARKRAEIAERTSDRKFRDFEESREVRRVHKKYPQIDPKKKDVFNEMFWDDVRKEIATAPILRGETITFMEAADKIWNERYAPKEVGEVKKKDKEKMEEVENQKRNINATTVSVSRTDDFAPADTEALREAVIHNKRGALAERLKRSGY